MRLPNWLPPLALAALVVAALGVSLGGAFVWDDAPLIVDNPSVRDPGEIPHILTAGFWETEDGHDRFRAFYRPLVSLTYALDHAVWGLDPLGFHLTNLLLHFACCWLVYRLALAEGLMQAPALAGAALFAVHPVHVESVAWISGRTDLLCGVLLLGAFLAHRKASAAESGSRMRVLSWALAALALLAKEMAATLPFLVFGDRLVARAGRRSGLAAAARAAAPYLAILAGYVLLRRLVLEDGGHPVFTLGAPSFAATAVFLLARYVTLLILPVSLDAHYPDRPLETLLDPRLAVAALLLGGLAFAAWRLHRAGQRAAYWLLWLVASLAPVLLLGRFGDVLLAERFLYIPSAGLALLAAHGLERLALDGRRRVCLAAAAAMVVLVALSSAASASRCRVWKDDLTLFRDMVETSPGSALVRNNLGLSLYRNREYEAAIAEFRLATALADDYSLAHNNLAAALERAGRPVEALAQYRDALRSAPGLVEASANAGNLLVRLGRPEEGFSMLEQLVHRVPRSAEARFALASALDLAGRGAEALEQVDALLALAPEHAGAYYLAGKLRYDQGRTAEAAAAMRRFLELVQDSDEAHLDAARRVIAEARGRAG